MSISAPAALEALKLVGAVLGVVTFLWELWDVFHGYLYIDLGVDCADNGAVSAKTVVENKSGKLKQIHNALLLVRPESESPISTFNLLTEHANLQMHVRSTGEIAEAHFDEPLYDDIGRAAIPLDFYYSENIEISGERLTYRVHIVSENIRRGTRDPPCAFLFGRAEDIIGPLTIHSC